MPKWTIGTLKEYFERILDEKDKANEARFKAIEKRLDSDDSIGVPNSPGIRSFALIGSFIGVFIVIITGISLLIGLAGRG